MLQRLTEWGYHCTKQSCTTWLSKYRELIGGIDGNAAIFTLARQDLRKWYYVDELTPKQIQVKYREDYGVFADAANLGKWLRAEAQKPEKLEFNESIHAHPAGEYVLLQLQNGMKPEDVVSELMKRYIVEASWERVAAYRHYREQIGGYWTMSRLERLQWEYLYDLVTLGTKYGTNQRQVRYNKQDMVLRAVRMTLCKHIKLAEELIPIKVFADFYAKHEEYARLRHRYPQASILKDTLPLALIDAHRKSFATDEVLPDVASKMFTPKQYRGSWRAAQVAQDSGYIAFTRTCGDAALVAAYAMHKFRELY